MLYHDFHLSDYLVSESGNRITLHLVYDYPPEPRLDSMIEFANVAAYDFVHTGGSIITDIRECTVRDLISNVGGELRERFRFHGGYLLWNDDPQVYLKSLESESYRAWEIESAIGFAGYVIAKQISQLMPNQSSDPALASVTTRAGHEPRHR